MSDVIRDMKYFWSKKHFAFGITLMMLLSYGTLLLNPTIGIDDTAFKVYFVDGVSPAVGRWCIFLINKFFPLEYNPFFVEAIGLLLFALSVTLWCVVFYRLFGAEWRNATLAYTVFGCVMLSSPMISELIVWYIHNGIFIAYGITAIAVLLYMDTIRCTAEVPKRKQFRKLIGASLVLTAALGFYESFMIVFLMAVVMVFFVIRLMNESEYDRRPLIWLRNIVLVCLFCTIFRTLTVKVITAVWHLESQKLVLTPRGVEDILRDIFGWFNGTRSISEFTYILKDFLVKYYFNAVVYVPVMILVLAVIGLMGWGVVYAIRKKDGWILAAVAGILMIPWIMPILEGVATYYRASQYVPLLTAFVVLLTAWSIRNVRYGAVQYAALFMAVLLLYRQGYEMNRWLYVDAMKYEDTKRTLDAVALRIQEECDAGKPVCVIGHYQTPEGLISDVYCPVWSKKYTMIKWLVQGLDEELFAQYDTPYGYAAAETPQLSFINWGSTAFFGFDRELVKFWKMHGFSFVEDGNQTHYEEARELMKDGPVWPEEGSVLETEQYIIVNFGNY